MRLHEMQIQELNLGVQQIHAQFQKICLKMQILKKDRVARAEVRKDVWCIKCKGWRHEKYHCPVFMNYVIERGPIPLWQEAVVWLSVGPMLWCAICQVAGNT